MPVACPWKSYRQVATQTAPPGQLVLMLYQGAIRFLEQARLGFAKEDPAEFHQTISNNVLRAQEIIQELNLSLNMKEGGELAVTLRRLYDYMDWRLTQSNVKKEEEGLKDVIGRLTVLRESWASMLQNQAHPAGMAAAEQPPLLPELAVA
jgi:flagellar secretion chaperone FliS